MSNEQDKAKRGTRLQRALNTIMRQLKIAKSAGIHQKYIDQPHRLAKHHAMDCGVPNCPMCSSPRHNKTVKGKDKLTVQERRNNQKSNDD